VKKETITISYVGKFGPNVNGEWFNVDQKSGLKVEQFEKGKTYTVLINESKTGKKYITQIIADEKPGDDKILEVIKNEEPKKEYKSRDFDAEARGKVACAAHCAALQSPGLAMYATNKDEYIKLVKEAAKVVVEETFKQQRGE
jgi:hypothetical protein